MSQPGAILNPSNMKGSRLSRLLIPFALLVGAVVLASGLRAATVLYGNYQTQRATQSAARASHMAIPSNPAIEQEWGIRVTLVQLLADGGLVELRYEVLNTDRANRLHADSSVDSIPTLRLEGTDQWIRSTSLMFHYHHGDKGTEGRTYSIVYGNAGSMLHPGSLVTVHMADGLELQRIPVLG